ncbi:MAG: beta-mannosidase [Bacteroidales bacterium]|nr:beta-mannosidase [Bacteroidales bacterium]
MRTILSLLIAALLLSAGLSRAESCKGPADKKATAETRKLFNKIKELRTQGIMFGHQDDLAYGIGWIYPNGSSDVLKVTGDYPAVFGWDLGHLETGSAHNLDSVPFNTMKELARQVYSRGGINQFSWHCNNPLTGGSTWDVSNPGTVKSILEGGEKHQVFISWLDKVADFLGGLRDENGRQIPVLFRPYHEFDGGWFWWGKPYCSNDEYKQLYQFTFDYLVKVRKIHNLIFVFSNTDLFTGTDQYLERYPGNEYADIIGFDTYQDPKTPNETFTAGLRTKLEILESAAKQTGKIPALTEIGYEQIPYPSWWTEVLWASIKDYSISYALLWRNAANRPNHYYMPYPGQQSEKDFIELYKLPRTLFGNDLKKTGEK